MSTVYFVSIPGERHEDHVPLGIYTSWEIMIRDIKERYHVDDMVITHEDPDVYSVSDSDGDLYANIYMTPVNELRPEILQT